MGESDLSLTAAASHISRRDCAGSSSRTRSIRPAQARAVLQLRDNAELISLKGLVY